MNLVSVRRSTSTRLNSKYGWLILAAYLAIFGSFLLWTKGYPYGSDNNESFSNFWHAHSLYHNGIAHTKGLADEVFSPRPEASPYVHTHQGNFPRLFAFVLYAAGARSVESQIWLTTFTIGLAAIWLAFCFLRAAANERFAAVVCLLLEMTDYVLFCPMAGQHLPRLACLFFSFRCYLFFVRALGDRAASRWLLPIALLNFAALAYWEYVFGAFIELLCAFYALGLYWRRPRVLAQVALAQIAGGLLAMAVLFTQLAAYMGKADITTATLASPPRPAIWPSMPILPPRPTPFTPSIISFFGKIMPISPP